MNDSCQREPFIVLRDLEDYLLDLACQPLIGRGIHIVPKLKNKPLIGVLHK